MTVKQRPGPLSGVNPGYPPHYRHSVLETSLWSPSPFSIRTHSAPLIPAPSSHFPSIPPPFYQHFPGLIGSHPSSLTPPVTLHQPTEEELAPNILPTPSPTVAESSSPTCSHSRLVPTSPALTRPHHQSTNAARAKSPPLLPAHHLSIPRSTTNAASCKGGPSPVRPFLSCRVH